MYLNEIKLIGFVGQDAELKSSQSNKELVRFDVATKVSWKNRDSGEYDSRAEWHRIVVWGNLTQFAQTLKKGEHVYVSGELRYREYQKEVGEGKDTVPHEGPIIQWWQHISSHAALFISWNRDNSIPT